MDEVRKQLKHFNSGPIPQNTQRILLQAQLEKQQIKLDNKKHDVQRKIQLTMSEIMSQQSMKTKLQHSGYNSSFGFRNQTPIMHNSQQHSTPTTKQPQLDNFDKTQLSNRFFYELLDFKSKQTQDHEDEFII